MEEAFMFKKVILSLLMLISLIIIPYNRGVNAQLGKGEYIFVVNSNDIVDAEYLQEVHNIIARVQFDGQTFWLPPTELKNDKTKSAFLAFKDSCSIAAQKLINYMREKNLKIIPGGYYLDTRYDDFKEGKFIIKPSFYPLVKLIKIDVNEVFRFAPK